MTYNPTNCPGPGDRATWPAGVDDPADDDDDRSIAQRFESMTRQEQFKWLQQAASWEIMELIDDIKGWD